MFLAAIVLIAVLLAYLCSRFEGLAWVVGSLVGGLFVVVLIAVIHCILNHLNLCPCY